MHVHVHTCTHVRVVHVRVYELLAVCKLITQVQCTCTVTVPLLQYMYIVHVLFGDIVPLMYCIDAFMYMLLTCGRDEFPCDPCFGFTLDVRELFDT